MEYKLHSLHLSMLRRWTERKSMLGWTQRKNRQNMAQYHRQTFIGWPWKIIPSVRCSVCGRTKHVAFSRCTRFMPNTCEQPYIHAYTHITWDHLGHFCPWLDFVVLNQYENVAAWDQWSSTIPPSLNLYHLFSKRNALSDSVIHYIRQETLICLLSCVHVLLRGNSPDSVWFWERRVKCCSDWINFPNDVWVKIIIKK